MITMEDITPLSKRPNVVYFHAVARAGRNNARAPTQRRSVQKDRRDLRSGKLTLQKLTEILRIIAHGIHP